MGLEVEHGHGKSPQNTIDWFWQTLAVLSSLSDSVPPGTLISLPDIALCWKSFLIDYDYQATFWKEDKRKNKHWVASWFSLTYSLPGKGYWVGPATFLFWSSEVVGSEPHRKYGKEKSTEKLPYSISCQRWCEACLCLMLPLLFHWTLTTILPCPLPQVFLTALI